MPTVNPSSRLRDPALREMAYKLFKEGQGYKSASTTLALKQQTVRDWFRMFRGGHPETVFEMRSTKAYDAALRNKVLTERYQQETSFSELSAKYGVPAATIRKWTKRFPPQVLFEPFVLPSRSVAEVSAQMSAD